MTFPHISHHPVGSQGGDNHKDGAVEERAGVATRNRRRNKGLNSLSSLKSLSFPMTMEKKPPSPKKEVFKFSSLNMYKTEKT